MLCLYIHSSVNIVSISVLRAAEPHGNAADQVEGMDRVYLCKAGAMMNKDKVNAIILFGVVLRYY